MKADACDCGYRPRVEDCRWIQQHEVLHVICYQCGSEWVQ